MQDSKIEESFGLCGRGRGWDDLGEGGNDILTCILPCELNRQSVSDAGCSMLGAGAWG